MGNIFGIQISCDGAICFRCLDCALGKAAYISELEDNLDALLTELQKLIEAKNDVMTRVVNAEQQQQLRRLNKVQGWLSRVEGAETEIGELITDSTREIQKLCLGGYCSKNCKSSYKFGKKVAKKLHLVVTLMGEGAFELVAEKVPLAAVDARPVEPTIVGLNSTLEKVWRCLGEERVGIIGLYGMGGVGKTTLLAQINNKFLDTPNDFDVVIWVVVSKDMQLERIQEKIGERIGLLENRSLEERASGIFKILSKKKFLLLLDDVWERIDLTKVGIPFPSKNTSKDVFTTRLVDVCSLMGAQKIFKVECLRDKEAWELFLDKVGEETLDSHLDIPKLAHTLAKECGGLPLALITTGLGCKKSQEEWSYAIEILRRSASELPGMGKEVYPLLKFSYDSLSSEIFRSCLLYCSLFPEDCKIDKIELIECWIGEGFLNGYEGAEVHNQGYYIIGILVHACLLEEVGSDHVRMHDAIRDMTLWIACEVEKEKENVLVSAGAQLTAAPEVRKWEQRRRISLMRNKIEKLSDTPTCPHLLSLFPNINRLKTIASGFFDFMPSLTVLNLSNNGFLTKLPPGISKLVSLQYLNLSKTSIRELPKELKALVNLKYLNLEHSRYLHTIPRQLICSFSMLRVLRMVNCGYSDKIPLDSILFGGCESLVEELISLKHLNVLTIALKSFFALQRFLSSHELQNCTKSLNLRYCDDSKSFNIYSLADLKHLDKLDLIYCRNLEEFKVNYSEIV
ncbi:putative disease resistance protein [Citrus sinensis]|nr:putative disease resistance protein [Citrus sinensis]